MYNNRELINACKKNNGRAQEFLYKKFKKRLMGICIRYTNRREEAEDVFQESFIKIFKNIKNVQKPEYLERWMKHVTINTAINHFRKKSKMPFENIYEMDLESNEYENIIGEIDQGQLLNIIQSIPEGYKIIFQLYVIEGFTHKEIAKLLNISENTSKSQLNRAKKYLKKKLENLGITKYEKYG